MQSKRMANMLMSIFLLMVGVQTYAADPWACAGVSNVGQPQRWIDWLGRMPYCTMSGWLANAWGDWKAYEHPTTSCVRICTQPPGKTVYDKGYIWAYMHAYPEAKGGSGHAWYTSGPNAWSWKDCANGKYNQYYKALAENCVKAGCGKIVINLFNEANGDWFAWSMYKTTPELWKGAWRQIVQSFKSVPGGDFKFVWTEGPGDRFSHGANISAYYPGDDVVDFIGLDVYDSRWPGWAVKAHTGAYSMDYWAKFAQQHHKKIAIPEWGAGSGKYWNGDDPAFIDEMYRWMSKNSDVLAWHTYFMVSKDPYTRIGPYQSHTQLPKETAEYYKLFNKNASHPHPPPGGEKKETGGNRQLRRAAAHADCSLSLWMI